MTRNTIYKKSKRTHMKQTCYYDLYHLYTYKTHVKHIYTYILEIIATLQYIYIYIYILIFRQFQNNIYNSYTIYIQPIYDLSMNYILYMLLLLSRAPSGALFSNNSIYSI